MINLYEANQGIWENNRPQYSTEDPVNDKAYTPDHINNSDFPNIFQNETQYNKK